MEMAWIICEIIVRVFEFIGFMIPVAILCNLIFQNEDNRVKQFCNKLIGIDDLDD